MNVDISKEEFGKLADLLYIADIVVSGNGTRDTSAVRSYQAVIQKLYSLASRMEQGERIVYDFDLEKYVPSKSLQESSPARTLLDEFIDESFWHELIGRLTDRDLERKAGGPEKSGALSPDERFDLETPIEERYLEEFEQNGIERLEIVEQFPVPGAGPKTSD